jgi:hypothetical protein
MRSKPLWVAGNDGECSSVAPKEFLEILAAFGVISNRRTCGDNAQLIGFR